MVMSQACAARVCLSGPASEVHVPVRLPGQPTVAGESLLPVGRRRGDAVPAEPDQDGPTIESLTASELPSPIDEAADDRWQQSARDVVGPVDRPLIPIRVVDPDCRTRIARPFPRLWPELPDVADSAKDGTVGLEGDELLPLTATCQPRDEPAVVDPPRAEEEIEVVPAVEVGSSRGPGRSVARGTHRSLQSAGLAHDPRNPHHGGSLAP